MTILSIDIETYSSVDLIKSGVYKYVEAPDFEVLMIASSFKYEGHTDANKVIDTSTWNNGSVSPEIFVRALQDPSIKKTAYNANFELTCLQKYFNITLDPDQWECTQVKAAMLGLPMNLDKTAEALKLDVLKDTKGKALIRYFSLPCKPTKTNGERTRNLPHHDPEKWQEFKDYCMQDVRVEQAIAEKISFFNIPETEKKLWNLDQKINARGVMIDKKLVVNAVRIDKEHHDLLIEEASKLTSLENPNSVSQLKAWLESEMDEEIESLNKKSLPSLLGKTDSTLVKRVVEIRQELSKTSIKKYVAMLNCMCSDGAVRGLAQFYGANRTGRWAGRLIQLQNLARSSDGFMMGAARDTVRSGHREMVEMLFDNVPNTLSQLIRTGLISRPGKRLMVADFSAIEARVIAWLAKEEWRLDLFQSGKEDIYKASASQMFKIPVEDITKELRQKGKIAELACIAENQLVLTNKGLVPIQNITTEHLLWDGQEWVEHEGVVFKGIKTVITYENLTATEDHLVWTTGETRPIRFLEAATSGKHLTQTGINRQNIWVGGNNLSRESIYQSKLERPLCSVPLHKLRISKMDKLFQSNSRNIQRMSTLQPTKINSSLVRSEINSCKTTLHESERPWLRELRRSGDRISIQNNDRSRFTSNRNIWATKQEIGYRPDKQQSTLRERQFTFRYSFTKQLEQTKHCASRLGPYSMALCLYTCHPETGSRYDKSTNYSGRSEGGNRETQELALDRKEVRVFDILNAGPRHRFTVSGVLVHNCGFGGGAGALIKMGALDMGLTEEELPEIISAWRKANKKIVKLWGDINAAAILAIQSEGKVVGCRYGIKMSKRKGVFFITLPSGRSLSYIGAKLVQGVYGPIIEYMGMDQTTRQWTKQDTYGGKLVENIVQAIARDCLAHAMVKVEDAGYPILFHVHDEVVCELPDGEGDLQEILDIMSTEIPWAPGLPLAAAGFESKYYKKD